MASEREKEQNSLTNNHSDTEPSEIAEPPAQYRASPLLVAPAPHNVRAEIEDMVVRDLLGPAGGEDEEIDEPSVRDRYLVGMLAPKMQRQAPTAEEQDELGLAGEDTEDGSREAESSLSNTLFPSSFGLSFCVDGSTKAIRIKTRWGRYEREKSEFLTTEKGNLKNVWKREQVDRKSEAIELKEGPIGPWVPFDEQPEVLVKGVVRHLGANSTDWVVSLFLVNEQEEPEKSRDTAWLFQPELAVSAAKPEATGIFCKRALPRDWQKWDPALKAELQEYEMLYRHHREFAVGHGVGATWTVMPDNSDRAVEVRTTVIPAYEVPKVDAPSAKDNPALAGVVVDMKELSETPDAQLASKLVVLADAYNDWIVAQKVSIADPDLIEHEESARRVLDRCETAKQRIRAGIDLLGVDPQAAESFRFANRAMWLQRGHSIHAQAIRRGESSDLESILAEPRNRSWRPFQLAFILLNLPSLTDLHHPERSDETNAAADLLWFPTGGGKTEAYLGLSAYAMVLRRLQGVVCGRDGRAGVAVLMRYTLRLLTLQQFQRAATLVCACELIRREHLMKGDDRYGAEPFRLGLWVGMKTTPNKTKQADEIIAAQHGQGSSFHGGGHSVSKGSPAQLTNCPWCGTKIEAGKHIKVDKDRLRTYLYCGDDLGRCLFSEAQSPGEGLPVVVVDEEIYRRLPAMLISTVDKFAQMPWNGSVQMLFGKVNKYCPRHGWRSPSLDDTDSHTRKGDKLPAVTSRDVASLRPPDLIIQDELHLITGPLGTLVGLYETAVDELCSWEVDGKRVRPKVIASTATIRRAQEQINGLFLRRAEIFPPSGTDVADNFFAIRREPGPDAPGRRYLGICAPGKRQKAALIRVYMAYLAASQSAFNRYGEAADPWMTLVGYFNSLRELGGMRRLVDDDIRTRLRDMVDRGLANRRPPVTEELTSRMGSTDIPRILDQLETGFDPLVLEQRKKQRKEGKRVEGHEPLDVLLATNMLSVGVDVGRLGLMVVAGQPKTTAEYIQATSRVGRTHPGLVCTVFNWARPRDLSHYEMFEHYHATFYRHVESLSVTPYSRRAMDRGLSAVAVSLLRLAQFDLNENQQAQVLDRSRPYVTRAIKVIRQRAECITGDSAVGDEVEQLLKVRLDVWEAEAKKSKKVARLLGYDTERDGSTYGLLRRPALGPWEVYTCLNSLRDVEPSVSLILSDKELD